MLQRAVTFARAKASLLFDRVVANVSLNYLRVSIELGQFLLYKLFKETPTATDQTSVDFATTKPDQAGVSDQNLLNTVKNLSEALAAFETSTRSSGKALSDDSSLTDEHSYQLGTGRSDAANIGDLFAYSAGRTFADSAGAADESTLASNKAESDQVGGSDVQTSAIGKILSNGVFLGDLIANFAHSKALTESIQATDDINGAAADDDQNMTFVKVTSDSSTIADNQLKSLQPVKSDSATVLDTGSARMQDYCDFSYFAEDYVGVSFTF